MQNAENLAALEVASSNLNPDIKDLLKSGVLFGLEKNRWNPKMKDYIFGLKNNIHINI